MFSFLSPLITDSSRSFFISYLVFLFFWIVSSPSKFGAQPSPVRYDKIDGFIKTYNGTRYLVLFDTGWFDKICDRAEYLISEINVTTDSINHAFAKI